MDRPDLSPRLEALLTDARALEGSDLGARLAWLEAVADATDAAALGSQGKAAALDFRAALGAIILYARGKQDPADLPALEATVRMFVTRAQQATFGALAGAYRDLAKRAPADDRAECAALAQAFTEMKDAITQGGPAPKAALDRLEMIRGRRAL